MPLGTSWTDEEDERLRLLVAEHGPKQWSLIAQYMRTKGSKQCRRRWKNYLNADIKKGSWTPEEDRILVEGHKKFGNRWTEIAKMVGGRTDNAVKNRWAALCKRQQKIKLGRAGRCSPELVASMQNILGSPSRPGTISTPSPASCSHHVLPRSLSALGANRPGRKRKLEGHSSMDRFRAVQVRAKALATRLPSPEAMFSGGLRSPRLKPTLSLDIPNAAGQPPSEDAAKTPVSIVIPKVLLTPSELKYMNDINQMDIPLHLTVDDAPSTAGQDALESAFNLARRAPGSAAPADASDATDLLSWLRTGATPRPGVKPMSASGGAGTSARGSATWPPETQSRGAGTGPVQGPPADAPAFHDGHRVLLAKVFQQAKSSTRPSSGATPQESPALDAGRGPSSAGGKGAGPSMLVPSAGLDGDSLSESPPPVDLPMQNELLGQVGEVLMTPTFSPGELDQLLETLATDDLPPMPASSTAAAATAEEADFPQLTSILACSPQQQRRARPADMDLDVAALQTSVGQA